MKLEGAAGRDPIRLYSKLEILFSKIFLSGKYSTKYRDTNVKHTNISIYTEYMEDRQTGRKEKQKGNEKGK